MTNDFVTKAQTDIDALCRAAKIQIEAYFEFLHYILDLRIGKRLPVSTATMSYAYKLVKDLDSTHHSICKSLDRYNMNLEAVGEESNGNVD